MKIGYFAPLPPARTGVADYAASLLRALRKHGGVDIAGTGAPLYQIGNNQLHRDIYRRALDRPGVVILHDAVLHHLMLGMLEEREYIDEFLYNYGEWSRSLAQRLWTARARSAADETYFRFPMLRRLAETSRAVIVHNSAAGRMVLEHASEARIEIIPHLFEPPPAPPSATSPPGVTTFAVLGHLRETKRLHVVLESMRRVPNSALMVAGDFVSRDYAAALEPLMRTSRVTRLPFGSDAEFWTRLSSVDVCVNLRSPSAGETSGISIRGMGIGKAVVVSDGEEYAGLPKASCARIPSGIGEKPALEAVMTWLAGSRADREAMGAIAKRHIEEHHAVDRIAARIWSLMQTLALLLVVIPSWSTHREVKVPMRDGIKLATNIHLPVGNTRFPVLLVRTPYNKGVELPPNYQYFVDRGYAFVIQDVRGRYGSPGQFHPLTQEIPDGEDTIKWIAAQPWSNGSIGMLGGSYVGLAQWKAALAHHPALKAIFPVHSGTDEYLDRFYARGGAFRLGHRMLWIAENLKAHGFHQPPFEQYVRHLPLRTIDQAATGRHLDLLQSALDHPSYDDFWRAISVRERLASIRVPVFSISGWYDPNVQSDLEAIAALRERGVAARIAVGPWGHNMSTPLPGADYGPDARYPVRSAIASWFDRWLKDQPERLAGGPVTIFVMGANRWRDEPEWPPKRAVQTKFFLAPQGRLLSAPGTETTERYTYDPRNPAPTRGGAACCNPKIFPWGPLDQRPVESRPDVLSYSSEPLTEPLEVTGVVKAQLFISTSAPDTDFTAKLIDVFPTGEARNLTDGILRLRYRSGLDKPSLAKPGEIYPIAIDAGVTSNVFLPGHRIRVEISSSNFPKYDRNPNTGRTIADETIPQSAQQTIYVGRRSASHLLLPVVTSR